MDEKKIVLAVGVLAMVGIVALYSMKPKVTYLVAYAPAKEEAK